MKESKSMAEYPLAVLTAERRDTWADLREHLQKNENNKTLLDNLDGALFGVFLDDKGAYSFHAYVLVEKVFQFTLTIISLLFDRLQIFSLNWTHALRSSY